MFGTSLDKQKSHIKIIAALIIMLIGYNFFAKIFLKSLQPSWSNIKIIIGVMMMVFSLTVIALEIDKVIDNWRNKNKKKEKSHKDMFEELNLPKRYD
jgi:diacylglycerol kinase